jgi:hypothetical protein
MKKRLLLSTSIVLLTGASTLFGQALPNGDFEDVTNITRLTANGNDSFTYDSLGGSWLSGEEIKKDIALIPDPGPFAKDTSWTYSGNHAVLMRTMDVGGIIGTGNIGLGTYSFDAVNPFNSVKLGVPFTDRPDVLRGYYAYESVANDSCWIAVFLSKWNTSTMQRDTIGYGEFVTNQSTGFSSYTLFEAPISYTTSDTPDTVGVLMVSSKGGYELFPPAGQVGSTLVVDSCSFIYDNASLSEGKQDIISIQSNETFINLQLEQSKDLDVKIFDVSGKLIEERQLQFGENKFFLPVKNAVYIINVNGQDYQLNKKILF